MAVVVTLCAVCVNVDVYMFMHTCVCVLVCARCVVYIRALLWIYALESFGLLACNMFSEDRALL